MLQMLPAIQSIHPFAVDVASGVETFPAKATKSH